MPDTFREMFAAEIAEAEAEAYRLAERDGVPRWWIEAVLRGLAEAAGRDVQSHKVH